jgi:tetratricopeptide (TPR) repeat protein
MLTKITKWLFYLFSFLLPLSFLPEKTFAAYFDKRIFLAVFVLLFFVLLAVKSFAEGRFRYPAGKTSWAMLAVIGTFFASSVFSGIFGQSIFGSGSQADSFFSLGFGFIAFFISAAIMESEKDVFKAIKFFIAGSSVLALGFLILSSLAIYQAKDVLAFGGGDTAQVLALVLGGALSALIALFGLGQFEGEEKKSPRSRAIDLISLVLATVLLTGAIAFINLKLVWFLVALATIIILCRILAVPSSNAGRSAVCLSFVAALLFFFFGSPFSHDFGPTILPSNNLSIKIAQSTFGEGFKSAVFGSGPGTFPYQFALHNGGAFDQTKLSGFVFNQGAFGYLTLAIETGLLGILALSALIGFFFWAGFKLISSRSEEEKAGLAAFILGSYFVLLLFFFWINLGLFVLTFWALGIFAAAEKQKEIVFTRDSGAKKTIALAILLALLANAVFDLYVSVRQYQAAAVLAQAGEDYNNGKLDETIAKNENAISLWPTDDYYISLSNLYLEKAGNVVQARTDLTAPLSDEETAAFKKWAGQAETEANLACQLNPKRSTNWQNLGSVYKGLIRLVYIVDNYDTKAIEAYDKAEKLYPQGSAAILGKAFVYDVRGDKNNALAGYRRYLEVANPENQEIKEVKARMEKLNQTDSSAASTSTVPASSGASAAPTSSAAE